MSRRNLSLLAILLIVSVVCHNRGGRNPHARDVAEAYQKIDRWALERPADDELVAGAVRGMVDVLRRRGDQHSAFLQPRQAQLLREEISGDFGGVGVRIRLLGDPPQLTVVGPPEPGTPAFVGGVEPDDRIVAIDGQPTEGLTMSDVLDQMRGGVGEPVTLSILRGGSADPIALTLTREIIHVPSVIGDQRLSDGSWRHVLELDQRVALVRITTFGDHTVSELRELIPGLLKGGVKALVIDLRGNAGGALDAAIGACNLFLPPGAPIVETRDRNGEVFEKYDARGGPYTTLPLAMLVDADSASASEIMAACLQDNDRAIVLGSRSYGKGTVQRLEWVGSNEAVLKLTSASYWRPSGVNIHRRTDTPEDAAWGVTPDDGYAVELTEEELTAYYQGRSARDLIAIDREASDDDEWGDSESLADEPAEDPAKGGDLDEGVDSPESEESTDNGVFRDKVLERALEYLQSRLDASAAGNLSPSRAG